jgi:glyoxylase-like metal-dependent hydrolase (beta-lactamase superfamily II)/rhodanese-related sulfurtransferase
MCFSKEEFHMKTQTLDINTTLIDVPELREMLETTQPVIVLDVRTAADRADWAIPGSLHFDAYEALKAGDPDALSGLNLPIGAPVVTVCGAGNTSLVAAEQLRARGIDARSLVGGMKAWSLAWNVAEVSLQDPAATVIQVRRTGKGCLSYLISDGAEAAVVDASVDPTVYQELAHQHGWTITRVLDTHIHADHLSRNRALAALTGASLYLPRSARVTYPFVPLWDEDVIEFGDARLTALSTPGHTLESMSFLLDGQAVFTGDTLFLEGVGRPDLEATAEQAQERARLLWASLQRLASLPGKTLVLPAHTSTPVAFDKEPIASTLQAITARVAALQFAEDKFVDTILKRLPPTPPNHSVIVAHNEAGRLPAGDPTELEAGANRCAIS